MIVVDASALLAFLLAERGHEMVGKALGNAMMSTVNLSEVLGRFARDGHDAAHIRERLMASAIIWVEFGVEQSEWCAKILPETRGLGLSLADRACLSLGLMRAAPILTADRVWLRTKLGLDIRCIR